MSEYTNMTHGEPDDAPMGEKRAREQYLLKIELEDATATLQRAAARQQKAADALIAHQRKHGLSCDLIAIQAAEVAA